MYCYPLTYGETIPLNQVHRAVPTNLATFLTHWNAECGLSPLQMFCDSNRKVECMGHFLNNCWGKKTEAKYEVAMLLSVFLFFIIFLKRAWRNTLLSCHSPMLIGCCVEKGFDRRALIQSCFGYICCLYGSSKIIQLLNHLRHATHPVASPSESLGKSASYYYLV